MNVADERGFILLGYLAFFDAPKSTAGDAVKKLKDLHVGIRVLTGDQKSVAVSICRRLDINAEEVLTGSELDRLTEDLAERFLEKIVVSGEETLEIYWKET